MIAPSLHESVFAGLTIIAVIALAVAVALAVHLALALTTSLPLPTVAKIENQTCSCSVVNATDQKLVVICGSNPRSPEHE